MPIVTPLGTGRSLPRTLAFVIGAAITAIGVSMLIAAAVSAIYGEWSTVLGISTAAAVTIVSGLILWRLLGRAATIGVKEGFATVGLAWFALSLFGALPYLFTGSIPDPTNAFFETASGFTTTGSSVLPNPQTLPQGIGFWRGLTQWVGGMGVIVLSVAILPLLGTGGMQLARAESPGPTPDRLTPRFSETAKRLWYLYVAFTGVLIVLLAAGDMDLFESTVHSFTTMSTGGFSTTPDSMGGFSSYTQWVVTAFMFIAGTSFALHYRALREPRRYWQNAEFRLFALVTAGAIVLVMGGLLGDHALGAAIGDAVFTVVSLITTTGFATADFGLWRPALQIIVVALMFVGGMAGSTAGSVKIFRIGILTKAAYYDLRRLVYPRGVFTIRFGGKALPDPVVESVQSFFLFYMFLFVAGTFALTFIDANLMERLDLVTAASAVASSLGNIGPGLGEVGPITNFAGLPALGKWLLAGLMIVGRLEIFPVLLLLTPDLWRR